MRRRCRSGWGAYADKVLAPLFTGGRQPTTDELLDADPFGPPANSEGSALGLAAVLACLTRALEVIAAKRDPEPLLLLAAPTRDRHLLEGRVRAPGAARRRHQLRGRSTRCTVAMKPGAYRGLWLGSKLSSTLFRSWNRLSGNFIS